MANLTNLVGLMNELLPGVTQLARSRSKFDELQKFAYIGEGPDDQVSLSQQVHLGLPAAATVSDRAAAVSPTRASDSLIQTALYTPFRTHAQFTDVELNKLVKKGELADVLTDGMVKCYERVFAGVRGYITNSDSSNTIPNLSAGTDAIAATHTLANSDTYLNLGTAALDTAALQAGVDILASEQDWSGTYTNARAGVVIASSAQAIHAAVLSAYGSSALDRNIGEGMAGVVLPGLGNYWMLSAGPARQGLRIDFRGKGGAWDNGGLPWMDMPQVTSTGQIIIPFGVDFAVYGATYLGQYFSNGTA